MVESNNSKNETKHSSHTIAGDSPYPQPYRLFDLNQFVIPELPAGNTLEINIKTTWGDRYYVGLNGIELFSDKGTPIAIKEVSKYIKISLSLKLLILDHSRPT